MEGAWKSEGKEITVVFYHSDGHMSISRNSGLATGHPSPLYCSDSHTPTSVIFGLATLHPSNSKSSMPPKSVQVNERVYGPRMEIRLCNGHCQEIVSLPGELRGGFSF